MRALYFGEAPVAIDKQRYYLSTRMNMEEHEYYTLFDSTKALQEAVEYPEVNLYNVQKAQEAAICTAKLMGKWFYTKDSTGIKYKQNNEYSETADSIIEKLQNLLNNNEDTPYKELILYLIGTIDAMMKTGTRMNTNSNTIGSYEAAVLHYYKGSKELFSYIKMDEIANMYDRIYNEYEGKIK